MRYELLLFKFGDVKKLSLIERGEKKFQWVKFWPKQKKTEKFLLQYQFCVQSAADRSKIREIIFGVFEL